MPKLKEAKKPISPDIKAIVCDPISYANNIPINKLISTLQTLSWHYYNSDELVSDAIFEVLRDTLIERDPTNIYLKEVGAPISKDKVKLPYSMFSLDKIKPDSGALDKWKAKYRGPYVASDKLDGVSALIHKNGTKIKMYTRGNGIDGQDISYLVPYVVPKNVKFNKIPDGTAIRGELIIGKKEFQALKKKDNKLKNARNTVAGLVNSKTYSVELANATDFIGYSVIHPRVNQVDQMKMLEKWKFSVTEYIVLDKKKLTEIELGNYLEKRRNNGAYDIDGIVVIDSSKEYSLKDSNPDHGFAFKKILSDQVAKTTVLKVIWTPSMHGYLKPKISVKPIDLGGVTIKWATAFHAKFVKENNLGPGSVIKLVRSGDVIPHILEVLKPSKSGKPCMPEVPYKWDKTNTNIIIKDLHGDVKDKVVSKKISNFFKVLGIKYISEGIVTRLVESGYNTIIKILNANKDKLADIDGIGNTLVNKIFDNIDLAFETVTLEQLMAGSLLLGKGMGVRKNKLIIKEYPDIMKKKWDDATLIENLKKIDGFDTLTAELFSGNFSKFKTFYKELKKVVNISHLDNTNIKKKNKTKMRFKNEKIVFTGFRDKDMETIIEEEGGCISSSVSKNTTLLVYIDKKSSKYEKAIKLNIKTITKDAFMSKYK